jgi:hypothetical protein
VALRLLAREGEHFLGIARAHAVSMIIRRPLAGRRGHWSTVLAVQVVLDDALADREVAGAMVKERIRAGDAR